jgi:hypothetical protein
VAHARADEHQQPPQGDQIEHLGERLRRAPRREARVRGEVGYRDRLLSGQLVVGWQQDDRLLLGKPLRPQPGQVLVGAYQRHVGHAVTDRPHLVVAEDDVHADPGVPLMPAYHVREHPRPGPGPNRDYEPAAGPADPLHHGAQRTEGGPCLAEQNCARRRQLGPTAGPLQQPRAQAALQPGDGPRQRQLRDPEPRRGTPEPPGRGARRPVVRPASSPNRSESTRFAFPKSGDEDRDGGQAVSCRSWPMGFVTQVVAWQGGGEASYRAYSGLPTT